MLESHMVGTELTNMSDFCFKGIFFMYQENHRSLLQVITGTVLIKRAASAFEHFVTVSPMLF